jgi:hypothetical protein
MKQEKLDQSKTVYYLPLLGDTESLWAVQHCKLVFRGYPMTPLVHSGNRQFSKEKIRSHNIFRTKSKLET